MAAVRDPGLVLAQGLLDAVLLVQEGAMAGLELAQVRGPVIENTSPLGLHARMTEFQKRDMAMVHVLNTCFQLAHFANSLSRLAATVPVALSGTARFATVLTDVRHLGVPAQVAR